jgi:hypothetical protein
MCLLPWILAKANTSIRGPWSITVHQRTCLTNWYQWLWYHSFCTYYCSAVTCFCSTPCNASGTLLHCKALFLVYISSNRQGHAVLLLWLHPVAVWCATDFRVSFLLNILRRRPCTLILSWFIHYRSGSIAIAVNLPSYRIFDLTAELIYTKCFSLVTFSMFSVVCIHKQLVS